MTKINEELSHTRFIAKEGVRPAFPGRTPGEDWGEDAYGLTTRLYIAAKILPVLVRIDPDCPCLVAARAALDYADALIEADTE